MVGNEFSVVDREELIFHSICIDCIVPVSVGQKKNRKISMNILFQKCLVDKSLQLCITPFKILSLFWYAKMKKLDFSTIKRVWHTISVMWNMCDINFHSCLGFVGMHQYGCTLQGANCSSEAFWGSVSCARYLAGYFDVQPGGAGIRTSDIPITRQPALPPQLQPT